MSSWVYQQKTGKLFNPENHLEGMGYSGNGEWKNRPDMQHVKGHGPIPRGFYTIKEKIDHPHLGKIAMRLVPHETNEMFGRGDFLIHGDSTTHPGEASDGCIIMGKEVRIKIDSSPDKLLQVI